jgi:hypothetical protein
MGLGSHIQRAVPADFIKLVSTDAPAETSTPTKTPPLYPRYSVWVTVDRFRFGRGLTFPKLTPRLCGLNGSV